MLRNRALAVKRGIERASLFNYNVFMNFYDMRIRPKTKKQFVIGRITDAAIMLVFAAAVAYFLVLSEYWDVFGPMKYDMGRTKNSIAAVVAGLIGQKLHEKSDIDLEIRKLLFPDARVRGGTNRDAINTYVYLVFTKVHFEAGNDPEGKLLGEVHKSEFNWKIRQISKDSYAVARWGPKFDGSIDLVVRDGIINGTYARNGLHFNWFIRGTYDAKGNVRCEIDGPLNLGIVLEGRITKL